MTRVQNTVEQFIHRYDNLEAFQPGVRRFTAFKPLTAPGEAQFTVNFPYLFVDRPTFTFGFELEKNRPLEAGRFPVVSAVVVSWHYQTRPSQQSSGTYVGARCAVVADGPPTLAGMFHLRFEGDSMAFPMNDVSTLTTDARI